MKNLINIFDFSMLSTKEEFNRHREIKGKKVADAEVEGYGDDHDCHASAEDGCEACRQEGRGI